MSNPRAAIGRERRRQIQIRTAFEAGLALSGQANRDLTGFYLACAAYIVFSMDRLHHQDQVIHDLLKDRIPFEDTVAHSRLDELDERQTQSRTMVEAFQRAAESLADRGPDGREDFENAAGIFVNTFTSLMAPRKNPFQSYTDDLFADDDWIVVADASERSLSIEKELFAAVQANSPDDIDPETMEVVFH